METQLLVKDFEGGYAIECAVAGRDFHLSWDADTQEWMVDCFDSTVENADDAHLFSVQRGCLTEAFDEVFETCRLAQK